MIEKQLSIRPYARLLTMLGEQLLKNDRVALVELIKNAYDADASRVEVIFEAFGDGMTNTPQSRIEVRDDGCGMSLDTIRTAWMNPATPAKFREKRKGRSHTPLKNRVIQGEKGIGRFAVLKLARKITLTTRCPGAEFETQVIFDFRRFDNDFVLENEEDKEIFLDELKFEWIQRNPEKLKGNTHGTAIELESLKGIWKADLIESLRRDVANLTDPVSRLTRKVETDRFEIQIVCNGQHRTLSDEEEERLKSLIEDKRVLAIQGEFLSDDCLYRFDVGAGQEEVSLYHEHVKALWIWRRRYPKNERARAAERQNYLCGDFRFNFYVFDFGRGIEDRYNLIQKEKELLREHRVYLYRDGVRVYPYGDPDDDWLNIDVTRGVGRAGNFFSNDQIIGWVDVTQEGNPDLRDKTNREGLIETGGAAVDLVFLIQTFLSYVKQHPFGRYQQKQLQKNLAKSVREEKVAERLSDLRRSLNDAGDTTRAKDVSRIEKEYQKERDFLTRQMEMTEDLAGVGLSVEMASHDIMLLMNRAQDIGLGLARSARAGSMERVREEADMLVGVLQQIATGMRDVQSLFKSSQRRRQVLRVEPILDKIHAIYARLLEKHEITYSKSVVGTSPLVANTKDGVLMQVLINLFDNAAFWLDTKRPGTSREIRVKLDGDRGQMVFSDSGPGIDAEDSPYIFEPFFSGKGQEGRGLGLYIARQLLERYGYAIELDGSDHSSLGGADFVVNLVRDEE